MIPIHSVPDNTRKQEAYISIQHIHISRLIQTGYMHRLNKIKKITERFILSHMII